MGKINRFKVDEQIVESDFLDQQLFVTLETTSVKVLKNLLAKDNLIYVIKITEDFLSLKGIYKRIKELTATENICENICFEISERDYQKHATKLNRFKKLGYKIAIDGLEIFEEEYDAEEVIDYAIVDKKPKGDKPDVRIAVRYNEDVELLLVS